jgi:hypothetical protein
MRTEGAKDNRLDESTEVSRRLVRRRGVLILAVTCVVGLIGVVSAFVANQDRDDRRSNVGSTAQPCASSNVTVTSGPHDIVGGGRYAQTIVITNDSQQPCSLSGYPQVTDDNDNAVGTNGSNAENLIPAVLNTQQTAQFLITAPVSCDTSASDDLTSADVTLPNDSQAMPVDGLQINTACRNVEVTPAGVVPDSSPNANDPFGSLTLSISLPETATAGTDISSYQVTLTNNTTSDVSLSPCPTFTYGLFDGEAHEQSGKLPCAQGSLSPGDALTVPLEVAVPHAEAATVVKVSWILQTPSTPSLGGVVPIIGN